MNGESTLQGVLDRYVYRNAETGYAVARLSTGTGRATVVGDLGEAEPGEMVRAWGQWTVHEQFGRQFKAERAEAITPTTVEGIELVLASGLITGIGPMRAAAIVQMFGEETFAVMEHEPNRLREVRVGEARQKIPDAVIREAPALLAGRQTQREALVFLRSHSVGMALARRIIDTYGGATLDAVKRAPFELVRDVPGAGFKTADHIAMSVGFDREDPSRLRAGLLHALEEASKQGHICLPVGSLLAKASRLLSLDPERMAQELDEAEAQGWVSIRRVDGDPAAMPPVDDGAWAYAPPLREAEDGLVRALERLLDSEPRRIRLDTGALPGRFREMGLDPDPTQTEAVIAALEHPVSVITGGPGVGKTTTLRLLCETAATEGLRPVLMAPTGRAARRMSEATGRPAMTIHKALGFDPRTGAFSRDQANPLAGDLIIADEVSMLDVPLARRLADAIRPGMRLSLVGDSDQLPSVGPGHFLHDLLTSGRPAVVELNRVHRRSEGSTITDNAHRIRKGLEPEFPAGQEIGEFHFIEAGSDEQALEIVVDLVSHRIPDKFGLAPMSDIQVLAPMYRGPAGVDALNAALQAALNPGSDQLTGPSHAFRQGDRIICLRNDYEREVFNGEIGHVAAVDSEASVLRASFDDRMVEYTTLELDRLAPAYAISVHRAQGTEVPCVILPVLTSQAIMLQRNLLYTAVTRARTLVVLVGSRIAQSRAVANDRVAHRHSCLDVLLGASPRSTGRPF